MLILSYWPVFLQGLVNSVALVTLGFVFGALMGLPMAIARFQRTPVVSPLVRAFVYVFRGTPLLVQAYLFYYGLAQFDVVRASPFWILLREPWWCVLVALSINSAAYQVEIYRGGLFAISRGEIEATVAFGMSRRLALRRILIPVALRHCLPMLCNESIFLLHGSAIASMLTVVDVLGAGRKAQRSVLSGVRGLPRSDRDIHDAGVRDHPRPCPARAQDDAAHLEDVILKVQLGPIGLCTAVVFHPRSTI